MANVINGDNGVVSGSVGLKYSSDSTGVLALQTNGNTAVTITTANNVGIGTTSPINSLDVVGNVRSMLQTTGDQTGISLGNNGSTNPRIQFSTSDGSPRYFIQGNGNSSLDFVTVLAGTNYTAMSLGRTTNNLVFGQNGSGIQFTNSSALTNSVLNDYETGTFTPVFQPSGYTFTQTIAQGWYTKIGNQVFCKIYMFVTRTAGSGGSQGIISGLPFTMANNNGSYGGGSIFPDTGASFFTGPLYIRGLPNTTNINLGTGFNGNPLGYIFTWSNMTTLELEISINYQATF